LENSKVHILRCSLLAIAACFSKITPLHALELDACAGPAMQTLQSIKPSATTWGARAVAIDGARLRWPGIAVGNGDQFVLLSSASASLVIELNQSVKPD
jgi:hypothetical protein